VAFEYKALYQEFDRLGFVEECGVIGRLIIEVFKTARPQFGFLRWLEQYYPGEPLSEEHLAEYLQAGRWWEYANKAYHINM
jgi:hypothetical protein